MVRRLLRTIIAYDFIENPPRPPVSDPNDPAIVEAAKNSKKVVINSAREGIVLLENRKDFLPLNSRSIKKIAVIGRNANGEPPTGAGSALVPAAPDFISEIDGIKSLLKNNAQVDYLKELVPDPSTGRNGLRGFRRPVFQEP